MKLLNHSQTSMVQQLNIGNGEIISLYWTCDHLHTWGSKSIDISTNSSKHITSYFRWHLCYHFWKIYLQMDEKVIIVKTTRQIWGIWKLRPAYSPETPNLGQNRWCFDPCDLEIWWMALEYNRASLLCCFKLCATFHSHWWIQTGVTVRKRSIWVKFDYF